MELVLDQPKTKPIVITVLDKNVILQCLQKHQKTGININAISESICGSENRHRTPEFCGKVLDHLMHKGLVKVKHGPNLWRLDSKGKEEVSKIR